MEINRLIWINFGCRPQ